jgi:ribulose-5-phosphate 4-epimerase/fuculose-1-phosphate aldolase
MLSDISQLMKKLYQNGWITTRDGNASFRYKNSNNMIITPSGWRKNIIQPEFLVNLEFDQDNNIILPSNKKPSGELHMHYLLQLHGIEDQAVVHAHPTYTIAAMLKGFDLQKVSDAFPELSRYTKVGKTVPILPVTTKELGEATAFALGASKNNVADFDIVGQKQHGVCALGRNPWEAFEHIERLEHICQIILSSGISVEEL